MTDQDIILDEVVESGRLVALAEVKEMLEEAHASRDELAYEQKIALEHARRFARIDVKTAEKLIADLAKVLPDADEKYLYRVADLLPQHPDDVQAVFQKARLDLDDETVQKVLDTVDAHYVP